VGVAEKKHQGPNHEGSGRSSPYGLSRVAPTMRLVDVAKEIEQADERISQMTSGKLRVIADQIRDLQAQAKGILARAERDLILHRAACGFSRTPGQVYYLYEKANGTHLWSLLSVEDWRGRPPHRFKGAYRLEGDQSWTPIDEIDVDDRNDVFHAETVLERLIGEPVD
jgi:Protein of unknown function (DUF2452)